MTQTIANRLGAGLAFLLCILFLGIVLGTSIALGHSDADWIRQGGYKNAVGELCCGERDCRELADDDVKVTADGYLVISRKETVPYSEAQPSPDGRFWMCVSGGTRKCFFAPPPGS